MGRDKNDRSGMGKFMNKRIALIMALLTLTGTAASCGSGDGGAAETTQSAETSAAAAETTLYMPDALPADLDFKGAKVNVFWWKENNEFFDEQDGDIVHDAQYLRDINVESRLNVDIKNNPMSYTWDTRNAYFDTIRSGVLANDGSQDIVSGQYAIIPTLISDGYLMNLAKMPYLDFDKPWYVQGLIEETTIDGKLYLLSGDYTMQTISTVFCTFYNKKLHADLKLEDMYTVVEKGDWTYDKLLSMISGAYSDLNGDGKKDISDRFGLTVYSGNAVTPFIQGFDLKITTMDKDFKPVLSMKTEKWQSALEKLCDLFYNTNDAILGTTANTASFNPMFAADQALFTLGIFGSAKTQFNDMQSDFGILPLVKWDDAQTEYYTALGEANTLLGIVTSTANPNATAAVMEAAFSESYRTVSPAYYETALKVKYSRDSESGKMFDIIHSGVLFNFGSIYGFSLAEINTRFKLAVSNNDTNWSSFCATFYDPATTAINSLYDAVTKLP